MRRVVLLDDLGRTWAAYLPQTSLERARGLRLGPAPRPLEGMLFPGCRSVNTFGMKFQILVAFLDRLGRVRSVRVARPGRIYFDLGASSAFECGAGAQLEAGQKLIRVGP